MKAKVLYLEQLYALHNAQNDTSTREIDQLLEWKQKALYHLTSVAPIRNRMKQQLDKALRSKTWLETLEQCLIKRLTMEIDAQRAQTRGRKMDKALSERSQQSELDAKYWEACCQVADFELEAVEDCFHKHLKQLIEIERTLAKTQTDRIRAPRDEEEAVVRDVDG